MPSRLYIPSPGRLAASLLVAASLFLLPARTFAQTRPTSSTRPATTRASTSKPAVDRSAPDKTWAALCAAAKSGDLAAFRACCYNKNEVSSLFMNAYSDTVITTFQLASAMAPLGTEGAAMAKDLQSTYNDLVKTGQSRKTVITGDTAQWVQKLANDKVVAEQAMTFKKVGDEWLLDTEQSYNLDTADGRKAAEEFIAASAPTLKALKSIIADIKAKKITSFAQVRDRLNPAP